MNICNSVLYLIDTIFTGEIELAGYSVNFKANANGLVVVFDKDETFDNIFRQISEKLESGGFFFQTRYLAISYRGRQLSPDEEGMISQMMAEKTGAKTVIFKIEEELAGDRGRGATGGRWNDDSTAAGEYASTGRRNIPADLNECVTKYFRGTLRSGQRISYNGNMVVVGDVNTGAEVEATGNIIVLGNVMGTVHAGAAGNTGASVTALNFATNQLKIAGIINKKNERHGASSGYTPEIAYIENDEIVFEPLHHLSGSAAHMPAR